MSYSIASLLENTKKVSEVINRTKCNVSIISAGSSKRISISSGIIKWLDVTDQISITVVGEGIIISAKELHANSCVYKVKPTESGKVNIYSVALITTIIEELELNFGEHTSKSCRDVKFIDEGEDKAVLVIF